MSRHTQSFNADWKFSRLPENGRLSAEEAVTAEFDDCIWEDVCLPHTFNSEDGARVRAEVCEGGENYYRGLACYRKHFSVSSAEVSDSRLYIEFGAANTVAAVFVGGIFVGTHKGGYSAFRFEITDFLQPDIDNVIVVLVSNAPSEYVAPITDQGDFTKMGGLYRDVRLIAVNAAHIALNDCSSSGVYITPKNIAGDSADIDIRVGLEGCTRIGLSLHAEIFEDGEIVASTFRDVSGRSDMVLTAHIDKIRRWNGRDDPHLYKAVVRLYGSGRQVDDVTKSFGIREYHIDPEKGFFLNGRHLDLRGVNYHQDSCESGWAMTNIRRDRDYQMICDMGCTAVRMAHYQHRSYEYDLCDRLGLCVWTEIGIVNKMCPDDDYVPSEMFRENAKQQLRELIRQNYNHPSVILWGLSNELHQMSDEIFEFYKELNTLANAEDPTRLKTFADAQFWGKFLELPADVVGYNRYFGWYHDAGPAEQFGEWLDLYHTQKESRPVCVSEYGGGGAISQHKDSIDWQTEIDPWGERHYENYQSELHEKIWQQFAQREYLWGKFIWCMFDFASCGREEGDTKGQNDKGLCTRGRLPKDAFFFYKSAWSSEPVVHICDKRFSPRPCEVSRLKVYSNAESCELTLNGRSLGIVHKTDLDRYSGNVFVWENVRLDNGENEIKAAGVFDGCEMCDTAIIIGTDKV